MRIHTNLSGDRIAECLAPAGRLTIDKFDRTNSRSSAHKYDVKLTASWDQWGIFLNAIYLADPNMRNDYYRSHEHFRWVTGNRFDKLTWNGQHTPHKWGDNIPNATGSYVVAICTGCNAIRRSLVRVTWEQLQAV